MILPTGKTTGAEALQAFTLIELILVMAMLSIVLAVAAPSLSNFFRGRSLDSEARRFVALTRYGQSRAVSEGVPMVLWIDSSERAYGLEQEVSYTSADDKAVDFDLGKDLQIQITELATRQTQGKQTSVQGRNSQAIRFGPDGFITESSPRTIMISEAKGDAIWISQSRNRLNYEIQTNILQNVSR
jgi:type II secretion system protein H